MSTPNTSDTQFVHSFGAVLGLLIAFTIVLFFFARVLGKDYQSTEQRQDPLVKNSAQYTPPQNTPQQNTTP